MGLTSPGHMRWEDELKKPLGKSLALATSLSLALSTVPITGVAYAAGEGSAVVSDAQDVTAAQTPARVADATPAVEGRGTDESVDTTVPGDAGAVSSEGGAFLASGAASTGASTAATDGTAPAAVTQVVDAGAEETGAGEQKELREDTAKAAEQGNPGMLSDAELDALVMQLDSAEVQQDEEGGISLIAQAIHGWKRIWGETALDTMQKVLQTDDVFATQRGGNVVVATADGYWDALSACGLAGIVDAPIVLTSSYTLSPQAKEEISRLRPEHILVMGGPNAIFDGVYEELKTFAPSVERVWGMEAFDTAVEIYRRGNDSWGTQKMAIISTSAGYWDALTIAPYSYKEKCPIFLTDGSNHLSQSALDALQAGGFSSVLITGLQNAVSFDVEDQLRSIGITNIERIGGETALDTSGLLAKWQVDHGMTTEYLTVATSDGYWDALSAAPLAAKQNSVIVLVNAQGDYRALDAVYRYQNTAVDTGHIIGGTSVIPDTVERRVTAPWVFKGVSTSPSCVRPGGTVTVGSTIELGDADPAEFKYQYSWEHVGGGDAGNSGVVSDSTYEIALNQVGEYTITIEAFGPDGSHDAATTNAFAYNFSGASASLREGVKWYAVADMGTPGNRADGVEFCFTYRRNGDGATGVLQDWSGSPEAQLDGYQLGALGDSYVVTIEARDAQGSLGTQSVEIAPYKTGNDELDGIVAMLKDRIGGSGRDGMYRAYEYLTNNYTFDNMDRYPPGNWYEWAVPYALDIHRNGVGNCYRYASLMCWLARAYGFNARVVSGEELSDHGWIAHGWCVVNEGGTDYVIDVQQHRELRLFYGMEVDLFMKTYDEARVYYRLI